MTLLSTSGIVWSVLFAHAATSNAADLNFSRVEEVLSSAMSQRRIPGVVLAIVQRNQVVMQKGFGVANLDTAEPVKPEMLFLIASATKMFTAAGLVKLAEQGKVDLNAPIGKYITGLHPAVSQLTPHQLLTHTSGLTEGEVATERIPSELPLLDSVRMLSPVSTFEQPGRVFSYSNLGFALAGALIESVTGESYTTSITNAVLKPLKMTKTMYDLNIAVTFPFSQGHRLAGPTGPEIVRPYPRIVRWGQPGFGLFSTVADLANFAQAFMTSGRLGQEQTALSSSVIQKMSSPAVPFPYEGDYGYGLRVYQHRGVRVIEHGGQIIGFGSLLYMIPEHQVAIIILANMTAAGRLYPVVDAAMDAVLGATMPSATNPFDGKASSVNAEEAAEYAGTYANTNEIQLLLRSGRLFYKENGPELPVSKLPSGFFVAQAPFGPVYFVLKPGTDGRTVYLYKGMAAYKRRSRN